MFFLEHQHKRSHRSFPQWSEIAGLYSGRKKGVRSPEQPGDEFSFAEREHTLPGDTGAALKGEKGCDLRHSFHNIDGMFRPVKHIYGGGRKKLF